MKMTDDYYNNRYSRKHLPLFNNEPHNIVPSTLHIFMGVAIDVFKSLLTIDKNNSTNIVKNIEQILLSNKID